MGTKVICNNAPLAFYDSKDGQNHRKDYAFGNVFPLLAPLGWIPPFQFVINLDGKRPAGDVPLFIDESELCRLSDDKAFDCAGVRQKMKAHTSGDGYATVYYPGGYETLYNKQHEEGRFYLCVNVGYINEAGEEVIVGYCYSEVFCMSADTQGWMRIDYRNTEPLDLAAGQVLFPSAFTLYLDTQPGRPKYVFEEEVSERMGYAFVESQMSKKTYNFTALAPEYLCDAMRLIRLCDRRTVESMGRVYNLSSFDMDVSWEEQGDVASLSCSFDTDTVVCNVGGYVPESALRRMGFTDSFNNDFN